MVVFFTDISQRVFGSDTNFFVSVEHSIAFQFLIITASIDVFFSKWN